MSVRAHDAANRSSKPSVTRETLRELFTLFAESLCALSHGRASASALNYLDCVVGGDDGEVCHVYEEAAFDDARQEL